MDSERCTSYEAYQQQKCNNATLLSFCRDAATALPDIIGDARIINGQQNENHSDNDSDSAEVAAEAAKALASTVRSFAYKKRDHFEMDTEWKRMRLTNRKEHRTVSIG